MYEPSKLISTIQKAEQKLTDVSHLRDTCDRFMLLELLFTKICNLKIV